MELMPGYKETDLGVIPEDWDVMPLADVCSQICDGTHFTPRYVPQGVPFYSVENVTANDFENTKFISEEEHSTLIKRCKPERGDILMTRITAGIVGDTRIIDWDVHASIYVSLALLKPNNRIESEYLYRYSRSTAFVKDTEKRALTNATPKKINMQDIGSIPIPVPKSTKEQRAIATALSDVEALLDGLDRLIAKKRDVKQAAMQQLLTGKTRLPGFEGEWETKPLREFAPLQRGFDLPNSQIRRGKYPVVYSNGIMNHHDQYQVKGPGVVTGRSGTIGKLTFVNDDYWPHNTSLWVTDFKANDPKFVFYLYSRLNFERFSSGSGVPTLNRNDLHSFDVFVPVDNEEQRAISTVLADMDAELEALEKRRNKTRDLKQAVMQELLTGRTRLV